MLTEKGWEASQSSIEEETRLRKEKEEKKHLNIIASQVSMVDNKGDNNFIQTHVANLTEAKKEGLLKKIWSKIIVTAVAGLFGALIHMYFKN
jgi:tRNA A37 threonylcarbamoyladenosine dehydratase